MRQPRFAGALAACSYLLNCFFGPPDGFAKVACREHATGRFAGVQFLVVRSGAVAVRDAAAARCGTCWLRSDQSAAGILRAARYGREDVADVERSGSPARAAGRSDCRVAKARTGGEFPAGTVALPANFVRARTGARAHSGGEHWFDPASAQVPRDAMARTDEQAHWDAARWPVHSSERVHSDVQAGSDVAVHSHARARSVSRAPRDGARSLPVAAELVQRPDCRGEFRCERWRADAARMAFEVELDCGWR